MASLKGVEIRIPPLELKENSELECWREFILRFEIALINTNLALHESTRETESGKHAVSGSSSQRDPEEIERGLDFRRGGLLLNSIGAEGYRIFTKWNIGAERILYSDLKKRYEEQFAGRQNLFITRHRFLSLEQLATEKVEAFIDRVAKAATFCRLGDLENDMTLQIVTKGLRNDKLRKELLATADLNVQKARNICHLFTTAEESNDFLNEKTDTAVSAVVSRPTGDRYDVKKPEYASRRSGECYICKSRSHWANNCPNRKRRDTTTREFSCYQCGLRGHIARNCNKKPGKAVREVKVADQQGAPSETESDESF